jgi:hypothetical protein
MNSVTKTDAAFNSAAHAAFCLLPEQEQDYVLQIARQREAWNIPFPGGYYYWRDKPVKDWIADSFSKLMKRLVKNVAQEDDKNFISAFGHFKARAIATPTAAVALTDIADSVAAADFPRQHLKEAFPDVKAADLSCRDAMLIALPKQHGGLGGMGQAFLNAVMAGTMLHHHLRLAAGSEEKNDNPYAVVRTTPPLPPLKESRRAAAAQILTTHGLDLDTLKKPEVLEALRNYLPKSAVLSLKKRV